MDRPELLVTGLPARRSGELLNGLAAHLSHAEAPVPGERFRMEVRGAPLVEIVRVAEPCVHLPTAAALFGDRLRALQLVYADDRNRWPWERGYRGGRGGQPVLGPRKSFFD